MMIQYPDRPALLNNTPGTRIQMPGLPGLSDLAASLISFWKMDESSGTRADSVGTNTLADSGVVPSTTGLVYGNAGSFDGSADYLSIADNASIQTGDIDYWVAAWVYPTALPTTDNVYQMIMTKSLASITKFEYSLDVRRISGTTRFRFVIYNSAVTVVNEVWANGFGTPTNNNWYLVLAYHSATSNQLGISINGGAYTTAPTSIAPATGASPFEIGRYAWNSAFYFPGRIGPAMFGKNYIPLAADTSYLYNSGAGRTLAAMGL